jgi:pilus assembly protein CpaC
MNALGLFRATILVGVIAAAAVLTGAPAYAQNHSPGYMRLTANDILTNRSVYLGVDKSTVIELPRAAGDVLVSNPAIADAVLRTSTRLYLIGVKLGQANVFLFDQSGKQMASFNVYVEADLGALNQLLAEAIPDGYVRAAALNGSIVLRGQVSSSSDASRAVEITNSLIEKSPDWVSSTSSSGSASATGAGNTSSTSSKGFSPNNKGGPGVINLIAITGEEQVSLKVTIAEVQREVVKQLGINVQGNFIGENFATGTSFKGPLGKVASGVGLSPLVNPRGGEIGIGFSAGDFDIQATLRALDETNLIRTLAEPTLTAVSGETASFLAGGEFGYRVLQTSGKGDTVFTTEFKPFGVQLSFTPIVLSPGRISIRVGTSVSELSGVTDGIPSFSRRSAETTVEQPSGGSFVIGGLLQHTSQRDVSGFPGLKDLPIIGSLFSSKDFLDRETELVIIVTPYLVKPTSPEALARPGDNMMMSSDFESYLQNRMTKIYGRAGEPPVGAGSGQIGFTFD